MMEVVAVSVPVDEGKQVLPADVDKAKGTQQAGSKPLRSDCRKDERERANGEGEVTALFNGMRFVVDVDGRLDQSIDWASLIRQCGGQSTNTVSNETTHLITTMAQVDRRSFAVQEAIQNGKQTLILTEQFLVDCLQQKRVCAVKNYILPVVSAADILAVASDTSSSSPSVVSLGLTTNGWHSHVDENQDESAPVIEAEEDVDKAIQKQKIEDVEMDAHEHVNGEATQANGNGEGFNPQPEEETIKEHKDTENEQNKDENEVVEERNGQIDDDEDEEELDISAYLPGKKMWRYREFGAPYFPHSYEIECMDFLVQKRAEGSQKPKKFFVMELHSGDYFGRQSFRVFFHAGCTGSTEEEKWCLYFENGQDAERAYRTLIEAKLANTHVRYDLNFIVPRNLIVGSDLARRFLEMGWMFLRRMQSYTEEPILEEGMDLVEQIKETLSKCTPASPISLILQSPEMVSLVLKNSFLELSSRNEMTDTGEDQGDDHKKEQEQEKEKGIEFDFADDVMLEYCEISSEEIRKEMEMAWRDVCFGLIEAGSNFNGFYKERKVVPIFEELIKNSGLYLHQLLKPFMGQQKEEGEEQKKVTMTVGQIVPFGKDRLCTVKFVSVLVKAQREAGIEDLLVKEIPSTSVTTPESLSLLRCAVESLFAFPWNNVLHCQVVEIVKEIFKSHSDGVDDEGFYVDSQKCSRLERYLLEDCALLEKILKVHGRVEEEGENGDAVRKPRQGNLGHITTICNCMVARGDVLFQEFWQAEGGPWPMLLDEWREFVETKLKEINARENATFFKPPMLFSSRLNNYWN